MSAVRSGTSNAPPTPKDALGGRHAGARDAHAHSGRRHPSLGNWELAFAWVLAVGCWELRCVARRAATGHAARDIISNWSVSFLQWIYGAALSLGAPGLFVVAFLDSSFVSLPQINDVLVVLMVTGNKAWMPFYAAAATLGSVAGCYVIYYLAERGGEAFLRKRLKPGHVERDAGAVPAPWPDGSDGAGAAAASRTVQAVRAGGRTRRGSPAAVRRRPSPSRAAPDISCSACWRSTTAMPRSS